jgi:hypothetical protein
MLTPSEEASIHPCPSTVWEANKPIKKARANIILFLCISIDLFLTSIKSRAGTTCPAVIFIL